MSIERRLRDWLMWKVWFPFILILTTWPVGCALHHNEAFQRAFSHGEFLIFSGLVLLEAAIELRYVAGSDTDDFWSQVAWFVAIVLIAAYGFVHMLATRTEDHPEYHHDLVYYAYFNCSVAIAALSVSIYSYYRVKVGSSERKLPS